MNELEKNLELIERYMRDDLSDDEQVLLDQKLIHDEEFGQLFRDMHTIIPGIRQSAARTTLEEKLARLDAFVSDGKPESTKERPVWGGPELMRPAQRILILWHQIPGRVMLAGLGVFFVLASAITYLTLRPVDSVDLFAGNFQVYPTQGASGPLRDGPVEEGPEARAFRHYDLGEYREALGFFTIALEQQPDNPTLLFYSGNAALVLGETQNAIRFFENVLQLRKGWEVPSRWYLALAWLQAGDAGKAVPYLRQLSESGGTYREKAAVLVSKLE